MKQQILIDKFFRPEWTGDAHLYASDLGWDERMYWDAGSDEPERIFHYNVVVVGYNLLFYWVRTGEWYAIETEKRPIEVRMLYRNPSWDGEYEYFKSGVSGSPSTCEPGKILATFDSPTEIWDNLKIEDVPIGEVLAHSLIAQLD